MRRIRIIPVLLLHNNGLFKSVRFKDYTYIGDPINAVKIFNEKEVDEIAVLDIDATREGRGPDIKRIKEITGEAFIPLAYGGGISTIDQVDQLFYLGVEKVIFNYQAYNNSSLLTEVAKLVGSQSVVASIDVKENWLGTKRVYIKNGRINTNENPVIYAKRLENAGAGELLLNNIDRDGTYKGYDIDLIRSVSEAVNIPVVAVGGASSLNDFKQAVQSGASAVAAGSYFVFQRPHRAVLITYPTQKELHTEIYSQV